MQRKTHSSSAASRAFQAATIFALLLAPISASKYSAVGAGGPATAGAAVPSNDLPYNGQFEDQCHGSWTYVPAQSEIEFIGKFMGDREHRMWHAYWHSLRDGGFGGATPGQQALLKTAAKIAAAGPNAKGKNPDQLPNPPEGHDWEMNGGHSGIDFFYMHHVMLTDLFDALHQNGMPCVMPWGTRLSMGDHEDMTYEGSQGGGNPGQDRIANLQRMAEGFLTTSNPDVMNRLKSSKLAQIGDSIEGSLHGGMHMTYGTSGDPKYRVCRIDVALLARSPDELKQAFAAASPPRSFPDDVTDAEKEQLQAYKTWTDADCSNWQNNTLYSTETSHVHWVFYKLHGLVEAAMITWAVVNGYQGVDKPDGSCPSNLPKCFHVKSELGRAPWVGGEPMMSHGGQKHASMQMPNNLLAAADKLTEKNLNPDGPVMLQLAQAQFQSMGDCWQSADPFAKVACPNGKADMQMASSDGDISAPFRRAASRLTHNKVFVKNVRSKIQKKYNDEVKQLAKSWIQKFSCDGQHMDEGKVSGIGCRK